ncbi:MAG: 16S rRNA (cytosine(1402)-N(4))-methyltransferase RsmH [Phycisphaerales bacterium]
MRAVYGPGRYRCAVDRPAHIPVLLEEMLRALGPRPGETFLDGTAGLGGHALAVAQRLGPAGTVVLNDADPGNLRLAEERLRAGVSPAPQFVAIQGNFADAPRRLAQQGLAADMVLADLGFSSAQMEDAARGLSFQRDGPLDMRFDPGSPVTAAELVGSLPEAELTRIIRDLGEEPAARRIAQKLVASRKLAPILTTGQLADIIRSAVGRRHGRGREIDPATKTFQALRIAVNDELGSLGALLAAVERSAAEVAAGRPSWLRPGARIAIISFHSLEDRPVKRSFAGLAREGLAQNLTGKPIAADEEELSANPRARSAKLRAIRVGGAGEVGG